jgi:two-component system, NarL family, response regulator DesR
LPSTHPSAASTVGGVHATRRSVLYVEDDPTLRGILTEMLRTSTELQVVGSVATSAEALEIAREHRIDVALLDLALGDGELTGIELGIRIRELRPDTGIVLLSQHVVPDFIDQLPDRYREGWSFIAKRSDLRLDRLTEILIATSRGLNIVDPEILAARVSAAADPVASLTPRQREIMALASVGRDATAIATELNLAAGTVRQELSKAYALLVPNPTPGTDLRTSAVLAYLRATHGHRTGLS